MLINEECFKKRKGAWGVIEASKQRRCPLVLRESPGRLEMVSCESLRKSKEEYARAGWSFVASPFSEPQRGRRHPNSGFWGTQGSDKVWHRQSSLFVPAGYHSSPNNSAAIVAHKSRAKQVLRNGLQEFLLGSWQNKGSSCKEVMVESTGYNIPEIQRPLQRKMLTVKKRNVSI